MHQDGEYHPFRSRLAGTRLSAFFSVGLAAAGCCNGDNPAISDNFDEKVLNKKIWQLVEYVDKRTGQRHAPRGEFEIADAQDLDGSGRALRISVTEGDKSPECDPPNDCSVQRAEIRLRNDVPFQKETWYAFSFRLGGTVYNTGSCRSVGGQWKQSPSGSSPFLAQRFDNGVFLITVQSEDLRVLVAKAEGDPNRVPPKPGVDLPEDCGPNESAASKEITVSCEGDGQCKLPNPFRNWVHMIYKIKGGTIEREFRDGEIEIWADRRKVATVSGAFGSLKDPMDKEFKFGIYRAAVPLNGVIWLANFRQGWSREQVDPAPPPNGAAIGQP